eukprot:scaffold280370_cov45-Prasinocladus_malaysianus.AAC.1
MPRQDESSEVVPTVGFAVDRFKIDRLKLTVMDMSGNSRYYQLWECYFKDVQVGRASSQLGQFDSHSCKPGNRED